MTWAARIPTLAGLRYPQASFVLDFASNYYRGSGAQGSSPSALPGYNFTRALAAYAEDTAGNLIQFASGVPRITNKGVLIEEARTNVVKSSGNFLDSTYWSAVSGSSTVTDLGAFSWGGFQKIQVASQGGNWNRVNQVQAQTASSTAGTTYTTTFWYIPGTSGKIYIAQYWNGLNYWEVTGTATGTLIVSNSAGMTSVSVSQQPVAMANGAYRVSVTWNPATTQTFVAGIGPNSAVVGENIIALGVQNEAGSFPTSYIPTTSASVTRPADVFYYSGLSISMSLLTLASSTISTPSQPNSGRSVTLSGGVVDDFNIAVGSTTNIGQVAGSGLPITSVGPTLTTGAQNIVAASLAGASARGSGAGTSVSSVTGSYSGVSTATTVVVGNNFTGIRSVNGYVQRLAIYPFAASDAQLQSISSGNF